MTQDWEGVLAFLGEQGWNYAYVKCVDLEAGTDAFYVSIRRGEESLTALRPSMEEAVRTLCQLAGSKAS